MQFSHRLISAYRYQVLFLYDQRATAWKYFATKRIHKSKYIFNFYVDPACQYIDVKHRCYKLDPSCPPEKQWNNTDRRNNSTKIDIVCDYNQDTNIDILIFLGFIIITNLLFMLYCLMKKNNNKTGMEIYHSRSPSRSLMK